MSTATTDDTQDIRIAVVLNGGVSLAVWISGVCVELDALVQASRTRASRPDGVYAGLLDLLDATARVDVIAGTSAGGLNGGFLSLGLVHGCDLLQMRRLWRDQGDLSALLRDPRQQDAPSLLRGGYFHDELAAAYRRILPSRTGQAAPAGEQVELYLTGTLWDGRRTPFTDDLGRRIVEVDRDATFHFSSEPATAAEGNLRHPDVAQRLAVASRCTSSFPGAFEPWHVEVLGDQVRDRWPSSAGLANFSDSQFVVDGGVLRNKPVRPAIEAVYRQRASREVRRVLAYVVPDPGGEPSAQTRPADDVPGAHEVLLSVLTTLRATDSVADELTEIERRNADAQQRRRTRDRLARAFLPEEKGPPSTALVEAAFPAYREVRHESAARTVSRLLLSGPGTRAWSAEEVAAVLRDLADDGDGLPFVPGADLERELAAPPQQWRWGQSAVGRLGDLAVDVLRRAVALAPLGSPERGQIVTARTAVHAALAVIRDDRRDLDDFWATTGVDMPGRAADDGAATADDVAALRAWLATTLTGWEDSARGQRRAELHRQARQLAEALHGCREALSTVALQEPGAVDPDGEEQTRLRALVRVLLQGVTSPDDVVRRMLGLEVVQVAFAGATAQVEQEVELVQISSPDLDLLTGVQEHHFGAFYRASWRVNDWMRGRLDGSAQLLQVLLAPERLRQLRLGVEELHDRLRDVAVGPVTGRHHARLLQEWQDETERIREELHVVCGTGPLPRTLPRCAARLAARLHADVLEVELSELAAAVRGEHDPLESSEQWAVAAQQGLRGEPGLTELRRLADGSEQIGRQRVRREGLDGTDTFARTTTHAAASLTSLLGAVGGPAVVRTTLRALRGYAVLVWVLVNHLTTRSHTGRNVLAVVVGVGAALLGLTLVVPGVPVAVPLVGAVLLLAAVTASALGQGSRLGWWLAVRVAAVTALAVAALAVLAWRDEGGLRDTLYSGLSTAAVVAAVVLVGWVVARARPNPARDRSVDDDAVTVVVPAQPAPRQIDLRDRRQTSDPWTGVERRVGADRRGAW